MRISAVGSESGSELTLPSPGNGLDRTTFDGKLASNFSSDCGATRLGYPTTEKKSSRILLGFQSGGAGDRRTRSVAHALAHGDQEGHRKDTSIGPHSRLIRGAVQKPAR